MIWKQNLGRNDRHEVHVLENDAGELLARIETVGYAVYYPWIMDAKNPGFLRRLGPNSGPLGDVKARCERLISGEETWNENTAVENRATAYRGEEV